MFGFGDHKISVSKNLFEQLKEAADKQGVSSLEEYVEKIIEKEVKKVLGAPPRREATDKEVEDITNKLKGLGYLE